MGEILSETVRRLNGPGQTANLQRAGYMSPQDRSFTGQGFACARCDWIRDTGKMFLEHKEPVGRCSHPAINANVEEAGCCDRFTYNGVHTS